LRWTPTSPPPVATATTTTTTIHDHDFNHDKHHDDHNDHAPDSDRRYRRLPRQPTNRELRPCDGRVQRRHLHVFREPVRDVLKPRRLEVRLLPRTDLLKANPPQEASPVYEIP